MDDKRMEKVIDKIETMIAGFVENLDQKPFATLIKVLIATWIIKAVIEAIRATVKK